MKRVLVTGASGFVGCHALAPLAARGFEVHAVSRAPAVEPAGARWHQCDLLDRSATERLVRRVQPTHLLHLAWYAQPGLFWQAPENEIWRAATAALVEAAAAAGVRRIVAAGTCAEYDWSDGVCDERATPLAPSTPYGLAKAATARALLARSEAFPEGCAWGRVFFLYGPHEHPSRLVASIIRAVLRGEPALLTEGRQRRDFLFVHDAAAAFAALTDSRVTGAVNVASGDAPSVLDIAQRAAEAAGRPDLLRPGALPTPAGEAPLVLGKPGRLRQLALWQPAVGLDDGLRAAVAFWRTHLDDRTASA